MSINYNKKPIFLEEDIWATNGDVVKPSVSKISTGFTYGEIPKHTGFNWLENTASNFAAHTNLYGIPEWDSQTNYFEGSLTLRFDSTNNDRILYIANKDNTNTDPLTDTTDTWRTFLTRLDSIKDVILTNLQGDDILTMETIRDKNHPLFGILDRVWVNKNKYSIMGIDDNIDVHGVNNSGVVLYRELEPATLGSGTIWLKKSFTNFSHILKLEDYSDVSFSNKATNQIFSFDGSFWTNQNLDVFVEWDKIFFKPQFYTPYKTSQSQVGGFTAELKNKNLYLSDGRDINLPKVPCKPQSLKATTNLTDRVTLTWLPPYSGECDPHDEYIIYRDGQQIAIVASDVETYDDFNTALFEKHTYIVYASNSIGLSDPSNSAIGWKEDIITEPTNLSASDSISPDYIDITWNSVQGANSYNLYKKRFETDPDTEYKLIANVVQPLRDTVNYRYYASSGESWVFAVKSINQIGESVNFSNSDIGSTAIMDGVKVFTDTSGVTTFTIPNGITKIQICAIGGGGTGKVDGYFWDGSKGGEAGRFIKEIHNVTPGDTLAIKVGAGGDLTNCNVNTGNPGEESTVSGNGINIFAAGGKNANYKGKGDTLVSECTGKTYADGLFRHVHYSGYRSINSYGGQASVFGNGGCITGVNTGIGAGGAAIPENCNTNYLNYGKGGDGIILIKWGIYIDAQTGLEDINILNRGVSDIVVEESKNNKAKELDKELKGN